MRKIPAIIFFALFTYAASAQTANALITKVKQAQQSLQYVTYTLQRTDTFVSGQTRITNGIAKLKAITADTVFGFHFWAKRDDVNRDNVYDGISTVEINHDKKQYNRQTRAGMFPHFLGAPGGQMILTDLVRIDTSNATSFEVTEDNQYYYLLIHLPDITEYDVIKRTKLLTIDKKLLLPVGMRSHQETLGKVQDLNYRIKDIWINDVSRAYDFAGIRYPEDYTPEEVRINKSLYALKEKETPSFSLTTFNGAPVSTSSFAGKVTLLDFWEVWCGPCIASMPKVQALYSKYKDKGLFVYGITNEKEQLETAKQMVQKRSISFPMLAGNTEIAKKYSVQSVPLYILINKQGKISFISEGFSEQLESEIVKELNAR